MTDYKIDIKSDVFVYHKIIYIYICIFLVRYIFFVIYITILFISKYYIFIYWVVPKHWLTVDSMKDFVGFPS